MSEQLRIGFVGGGVIAWAHTLSIRSLNKAGLVEARLACVYDADPEHHRQFADANRITACATADEVAEQSDVVFVCTSTAGHLDAVRAAVARGRPVFCEKPLGRSLGEAEAIAEVVRSAGVASQVGLVLRTAPVFGALGELVAGGVLGRPMAVQWRDDQFFPIQGHYASTWRADREIAGGGTLLEHSIHDVDILRQCFGEIAQLSGLTANFAGHDGIEDTAVGSLRLASGALATMTSVWHDVLSRPSTRRVEVLFEEGFVVLEDDFVGPMTIQTTAGTEVRACPPPGWVRDLPLPDTAVGLSVRQYAAEDHAFLDAVAAGRSPDPGIDEALAAHRIVDAWYRSADAGGAVVEGPW